MEYFDILLLLLIAAAKNWTLNLNVFLINFLLAR